MTATPTHRLATPEEIAVRAGQQVPHLRLPERSTVFAEREMRLRQRAASHPMRDFLMFMAELARSQHETLQGFPVVALPDAAALEAAANAGMPALPVAWQRDPVWRSQLRALLNRLLPHLANSLGSAAIPAVQQLLTLGDEQLEQQADRLLNGVMLGLDLAAAPLIAAGLQTYWTHLVLGTQATHADNRVAPFGRIDNATLCPCCGCRPTASISRIGGDANGYRYLHCSLCSSQWHMVRIKCTQCESTKGIHYQSLQMATGDASETALKDPVQAETCDTCGHYLKIVHMERDAHVEPVADDLATLTLDLLLAEEGVQRHGINLMLLFGDPDDPVAPLDDGGP